MSKQHRQIPMATPCQTRHAQAPAMSISQVNALLTEIRVLYRNINEAVTASNVPYFATGGYARDSYVLAQRIQQLDDFMSTNSIELAPTDWIRRGGIV